jgi:hypothetical protein
MSLTSPSKFQKEFHSLYQMFNMSLEEMSLSYPSFKLGINKNTYPNDKQSFNNIQANIFALQNQLFSSSQKAEQKINQLNTTITTVNKENAILTDRVNNFGSVGLAAKGELKMQKVLYNELYMHNIILGSLILLYIGIFFKKRN